MESTLVAEVNRLSDQDDFIWSRILFLQNMEERTRSSRQPYVPEEFIDVISTEAEEDAILAQRFQPGTAVVYDAPVCADM